MLIQIYAHGHTQAKQGNGGWGYVRVVNTTPPKVGEVFGLVEATTAPEMQLMACTEALKDLEPSAIHFVTTDKAIYEFFTKNITPKKAREGLMLMRELTLGHQITWELAKDINASQAIRRAAQLAAQGIASAVILEEDPEDDGEGE